MNRRSGAAAGKLVSCLGFAFSRFDGECRDQTFHLGPYGLFPRPVIVNIRIVDRKIIHTSEDVVSFDLSSAFDLPTIGLEYSSRIRSCPP